MSEVPVARRVAVSGSLRARRGVTLQVLAAMAAMAGESRAEPGCEVFTYSVDAFDPMVIRVFEIWKDSAALKRHRESNHLKAWRGKWNDLGLGDPSLMMFEIHSEAPL